MANFQLIRELLNKRKIPVKDFCERIEISDTAFRQLIERNSTKTEIIEKIARELNVAVGFFLFQFKHCTIIRDRSALTPLS